MMHKSYFALTMLLALCPFAAHADATADLFAAIAAQDAKLVAQALENGADVDSKRTSDGLDAKTFAFEQINVACQKPLPLLVSSASPFVLLIASFLHNKYYALASATGIAASACISAYKQNTSVENYNCVQKMIAKLHLDSVVGYASTAGLLASAWSADQLILSSVGTAGLASLYYQVNNVKTACEIYKLVDPEHVLLPELA